MGAGAGAGSRAPTCLGGQTKRARLEPRVELRAAGGIWPVFVHVNGMAGQRAFQIWKSNPRAGSDEQGVACTAAPAVCCQCRTCPPAALVHMRLSNLRKRAPACCSGTSPSKAAMTLARRQRPSRPSPRPPSPSWSSVSAQHLSRQAAGQATSRPAPTDADCHMPVNGLSTAPPCHSAPRALFFVDGRLQM